MRSSPHALESVSSSRVSRSGGCPIDTLERADLQSHQKARQRLRPLRSHVQHHSLAPPTRQRRHQRRLLMPQVCRRLMQVCFLWLKPFAMSG